MKIVVIGSKGMLGQDVVAVCRKAGVEAAGFDLPDIDISVAKSGLDTVPTCDWVINCAGYTDVDGAQTNREKAFAVNRDGAGRVAEWCQEHRIPLLYISTDYVFDGSASMPYREDDYVNPINAYGESKLAGERAVQAACCRFLIVRTQSLFATHGRNFVSKIMTRLQTDSETVKVVNDQTTCPTYTRHLADALLRLINAGQRGTVHVSASGNCTWYEFALAIARKVKAGPMIKPVSLSDYRLPARRPRYTVLDKSRYMAWARHAMPSWKEGLDDYVKANPGMMGNNDTTELPGPLKLKRNRQAGENGGAKK